MPGITQYIMRPAAPGTPLPHISGVTVIFLFINLARNRSKNFAQEDSAPLPHT